MNQSEKLSETERHWDTIAMTTLTVATAGLDRGPVQLPRRATPR